MGAWGESSNLASSGDTQQCFSISSRDDIIKAKGFRCRLLRLLSRATASRSVALKATQTLDGYDVAVTEQLSSFINYVLTGKGGADTVCQLQAGPAPWTGIGLGVETTIQRVTILILAISAHDKVAHRSQWSVIGNILDYSKTGATISTVSKRIKIPAITRGQYFPEAFAAGGDIW